MSMRFCIKKRLAAENGEGAPRGGRSARPAKRSAKDRAVPDGDRAPHDF